jgi:hypothetical protein
MPGVLSSKKSLRGACFQTWLLLKIEFNIVGYKLCHDENASNLHVTLTINIIQKWFYDVVDVDEASSTLGMTPLSTRSVSSSPD